MHDGNDEVKSFMTGLIIGGILGAGIALLLAPSSGEETRKVVREEIDNIITKGKEVADKVKEKAEIVKEKAEMLKEKMEKPAVEIPVEGKKV